MPAKQITLERSADVGGLRLEVTALDGTGIDEEVFKYHRKRTNNMDLPERRDTFHGVCRAPDMAALPVGAPDEDSDGFYRSATVSKEFTTASEVTAAWASIQSYTLRLLEDLEAMDNLLPVMYLTLSGGDDTPVMSGIYSYNFSKAFNSFYVPTA